jgi:hypothetical protein
MFPSTLQKEQVDTRVAQLTELKEQQQQLTSQSVHPLSIFETPRSILCL